MYPDFRKGKSSLPLPQESPIGATRPNVEKTLPDTPQSRLAMLRRRHPGIHMAIASENAEKAGRFCSVVEEAMMQLSQEDRDMASKNNIGIRQSDEKGQMDIRVGQWEGDSWHAGYSESLSVDTATGYDLAELIRKANARRRTWMHLK